MASLPAMAADQGDHRRPMGSLETSVLTYLWQAEKPLSAREVLEGIGLDVAYTTVLTILTRLRQKGLVEREQRGRLFLYRAKQDEADYLAGAMRRQLDRAQDQAAVLSRFVDALPPDELELLRGLLDDEP